MASYRASIEKQAGFHFTVSHEVDGFPKLLETFCPNDYALCRLLLGRCGDCKLSLHGSKRSRLFVLQQFSPVLDQVVDGVQLGSFHVLHAGLSRVVLCFMDGYGRHRLVSSILCLNDLVA